MKNNNKNDRITLTICKKCRDVMYYFDDELDEIPDKCEECGGHIIISDKSETEWYDEYYKAHPRSNKNNTSVETIYKWIAEIETHNSTEYDEKISEFVKQKQQEEFGVDLSKPRCPKCGSTDFHSEKRGFSTGRAIAAGALTGFLDVAAVAGAVGKDKMVNVCDSCGHKWK